MPSKCRRFGKWKVAKTTPKPCDGSMISKGTARSCVGCDRLGSGKYGKVIRVERPDEIIETARLRIQLRQAKEALADAHMELVLEKAYLEVACEQMDQTVEGFKKKHAGGPRTRRSRPTRS